MVFLLVDPGSDAEGQHCIAQGNHMELEGRDGALQHNLAEVTNIDINRVKQKQVPADLREGINAIKDGRHIHKEHRKYSIEILDIPKEHIQCRKD